MSLQSVVENLHQNFGLSQLSGPKEEDIIIDGKMYEEIFDARIVFELRQLHLQNANDCFTPEYQALTDTFSNEHRAAASQVVEPQVIHFGNHHYPPEYRDCFQRDYQKALAHMMEDLNTRRAIITFIGPYGNDTQPCLTSVQFVCREGMLNVVANFRSWELEDWAKFDLQLIYQMAWRLYCSVRVGLNLSIEDFDLGYLIVNTPSAHVIK